METAKQEGLVFNNTKWTSRRTQSVSLELNNEGIHGRRSGWLFWKRGADILTVHREDECRREPQGTTVNLLKKLLEAILTIIEPQLHDHLPGGVFWESGEAVQEVSRSYHTTNHRYTWPMWCDINKALPSELKEEIIAFYEVDENSRMCPGMKETGLFETKMESLWSTKSV